MAQIIVWDDGSTDATPEIVKSAMNADKRGVIVDNCCVAQVCMNHS